MNIRRLTALLATCFALSPTVNADDMPLFATAGDWDIRIDTTLNNGCFVMGQYEGGTGFRLGLNANDNSIYMIVGDPNWQSIEMGKVYSVEIVFGDETPWTADALGMSFDPPEDQPFLLIGVETDRDSMITFMREFMQESSFQLYYNDNSILALQLTGSYKAGMKLFECQEAVNSFNNDDDPFRNPPKRNAKDPFSS